MDAIREEAEAYAKEHMAKYADPCHDWWHVARVRDTALRIARTLNPLPDLVLVELAALYHDLLDSKFHASPTAAHLALSTHLSHTLLLPPPLVSDILRIVGTVSYKKEVAYRRKVEEEGDGGRCGWREGCCELWCVQDADMLDAMGAVGVMRAASFSVRLGQPLHLPYGIRTSTNPPTTIPATHPQGHDNDEDSLANLRLGAGPPTATRHFPDKLLRLKDMLKTEEGRRMGVRRHERMVEFLRWVVDEEEVGGWEWKVGGASCWY
ncbi:hypothetical protein SAICODRAFT_8450 [Saitoella complicata NRRL Y-17804]|nr:uncharacterized protein SAICODRAFT_8450 [Saitoella complicata NRRL Y-17804]ODQ51865.1 hypothetical protein SAICODRAFT_8450 [Saitoella complicata NRRL Y-17804]